MVFSHLFKYEYQRPEFIASILQFLCDIIGCHTVVKTRRAFFTGKDIVERNTIKTCISSGSNAEGLDLQGSDYDTMFLSNIIRVC